VRGCRPSPAHPDADQNAQTDLHAYQCGLSDGGGHGNSDTITDGHTRARAYGYARARSYGHTCAHGYARTHGHAGADQAAATDRHAGTNFPTGTASDPDA
jgi:hypothetical protein